MKKIISMLLAISMALALCACGEKKICDFCGKKYSGNTYNLTAFGRGYVCKDCYDILWGHGGSSMNSSSDTTRKLPKACITDSEFKEKIAPSYSDNSQIVRSINASTPTPTVETQVLNHSWTSGETVDFVEAIVSVYYETYIDISYIKQRVYWSAPDSWELATGDKKVTKRIYDFSPLNGTWTGSYETYNNFRPKIATYTFEISNAGKIELSGDEDSGSTTMTVAHNINDTFKEENAEFNYGYYFPQGEMPLVLKSNKFKATLPVDSKKGSYSFSLHIFEDSVVYSGFDKTSLTLTRM